MNSEQNQSEKKAYTTPTLSTHGDVASLTQDGSDGSGIVIIRSD